jgi:hypothetical protein
VHLAGARATIAARMQARAGHYMPPSLLDSQLRDLEALQPDEAGIVLDIEQAPEKLVAQVLADAGQLRQPQGRGFRQREAQREHGALAGALAAGADAAAVQG